MTRRLAPLVLVALAVAGCGGDRPVPAQAPPPPPPTPTPTPDAAAPLTPRTLAADLTATSHALDSAIRMWRRDGDPATGDAPPAVATLAAREARIHRTLAAHERLAKQTLRQTEPGIRTEARDVIAARRALGVLNRPRPGRKPPPIRTGRPEPADVLRAHYRAARARSGVRISLLAAVNLVESNFGRVRNHSVAGAQGPMQFMPATWRSYGQGGDVQDPRDAILGAARFLAAAGARHDEAQALYRYNPSDLYVTAVQRYAHRMRTDPLAFYALYASGATG
ncbi:MAG TPA: lytic transglycosylase domain-containing protein [Solirubrobacteraceae bacterium]|nr:lytic transglycosylase domain-containing protein [Solirubrobacteraceae bacterium]